MITFLTQCGLFLVKLLLLVLILGIIILVHELGHFLWAKKFGVHIYEFSIGMGPLLFTHKGKDKIDYNFRAIPIGGFVSMAGEVYDDDEKIPKKKLLCNKPWYQRIIILAAGVINNFILAIILLVLYAAIWGGGALTPTIEYVQEGSAAERSGIVAGDTITRINGHKTSSWDKAQIVLVYKNNNVSYDFEIKHADGKIETISITPDKVIDEETGTESMVFGVGIESYNVNNFGNALVYGFRKFCSIIVSMIFTIWGLITGKIALSALSGPVGIYTIVGQSVGLSLSAAISYIIYLIAYLSLNVGIINILPFPAFDGGHILFVLIEAIRRKPVDSKFENTCHIIGFALIMLLMIIVTISDIIKLF